MSKTRRVITVCLVMAVISVIIGTVSAVMNPAVLSISTAVGAGVIAVVLCITLLSSKKDSDE